MSSGFARAARCCIAACALALVVAPSQAQPDWESSIEAGDRAVASRNYRRAARYYQNASDSLPEQDPRRARPLLKLARVHRAQGDLARPEQIYRELDPLAQKAWGRESAEYAAFLDEVGRYYHRRRKYEIAERFYTDAFRTRVRALGKENAEVAESINNLAILFENQARFDKAEVYYRTALDLRKSLLGSAHVKAVETREHFARLLYKAQKREPADTLEREAHEIRGPLLEQAAGERVDLGQVYSRETGLKAPELETRVEPEYTDEARIARHEGSVALQVEIDAEGVPQNLRVTSILGLGLDEQALAAARQWRFKPARLNGRSVPFRADLRVSFSLL